MSTWGTRFNERRPVNLLQSQESRGRQRDVPLFLSERIGALNFNVRGKFQFARQKMPLSGKFPGEKRNWSNTARGAFGVGGKLKFPFLVFRNFRETDTRDHESLMGPYIWRFNFNFLFRLMKKDAKEIAFYQFDCLKSSWAGGGRLDVIFPDSDIFMGQTERGKRENGLFTPERDKDQFW